MSGSLYLQVFTESAHVASIVPMASGAALEAMKSFGGYDMRLAVVLAVFGAVLGQCFNWGIGKILLILKNKERWNVSDYWYDKAKVNFNSYGIVVLLFSWLPLCNFFVVAAGFLGARFRVVLPLVAIGQAVHYGMYLF